MLLDNRKIKKMELDFEIPELLAKSIDNFVKAHNSGDSLVDCYHAELYNDINNCMHTDISDENLERLRDYYIRGGMYDEK